MSLRKQLQTYSPRFMSEALYALAFKSFRLGMRVSEKGTYTQIWTRNSYRLGNWIPFQSDIDLSVWMARAPLAGDLEHLRATHSRVRRLFPVLGELNLYVATDLPWLEQLINPFELERDPELGKKLSYQGGGDLRFHAAAFLLRMLESDIDRVLKEPEGRRAKWDAHFKRITEKVGGSELDPWRGFPERTLMRGIIELMTFLLQVPKGERERFTEQLELYYQSVGRKVPVYLLSPLLAKEPFLWAAFPHRFCFQKEDRPVLRDWLLGLAQAQFSWELFGMLTQHRLWVHSESEKATLKTHLGSLEDFYRTSIQKYSSRPELDSTVSNLLGHLLRSL